MSTAIQIRESSKEEIQMQLGKAAAAVRKAMEMLTDDECYNERHEDMDEWEDGRHVPPMYRRRSGRYM